MRRGTTNTRRVHGNCKQDSPRQGRNKGATKAVRIARRIEAPAKLSRTRGRTAQSVSRARPWAQIEDEGGK
jgi:hypothetical protein